MPDLRAASRWRADSRVTDQPRRQYERRHRQNIADVMPAFCRERSIDQLRRCRCPRSRVPREWQPWGRSRPEQPMRRDRPRCRTTFGSTPETGALGITNCCKKNPGAFWPTTNLKYPRYPKRNHEVPTRNVRCRHRRLLAERLGIARGQECERRGHDRKLLAAGQHP